jgi:formate dehydrogenase subunit gamma
MVSLLGRVRWFIGAFALFAVLAMATPGFTQARNPDTSVNPTASSVKEDELLRELKRIQGRGSIPDLKSQVIEQPAGRDWRQFHEVTLRWIGAICVIGVLALLAIFYIVRGTIRMAAGRSGRTILRFNTFERVVHWMTAVSFIILGLSGLNITFGKPLLLPLIGPEAFTSFSLAAKYAHNYLSFPFTLGVLLALIIWIKDNIPERLDVEWLKQGGGMVGDKHPLARRFNAGQKIVFWVVVLAGFAMAITGYVLMFPFYGTGIATMQLAEVLHGVIGVLFVAAILAHIYIGTLGMEGAFEAMGSGEVDLNWAKEHHRLWVEEELGRREAGTPTRPRMQPAA